jgi:hypothetical protein
MACSICIQQTSEQGGNGEHKERNATKRLKDPAPVKLLFYRMFMLTMFDATLPLKLLPILRTSALSAPQIRKGFNHSCASQGNSIQPIGA